MSNLGRGSDAVKHSLLLSVAGLFWTAAAGFILFSLIWSALWFSVNPPDVKKTGWNFVRATVVSTFKPTAPLKIEIGSVEKVVSAKTLLEVLNSSPKLKEQLTQAKATAVGFTFLAGIPSIVLTIVLSVFFSVVGNFMTKDEHLRGVEILDSVDDFNEMVQNRIKCVIKVERGWVKRLRKFK